jgi:hypothetical protein
MLVLKTNGVTKLVENDSAVVVAEKAILVDPTQIHSGSVRIRDGFDVPTDVAPRAVSGIKSDTDLAPGFLVGELDIGVLLPLCNDFLNSFEPLAVCFSLLDEAICDRLAMESASSQQQGDRTLTYPRGQRLEVLVRTA